jgi:hypothetical protein
VTKTLKVLREFLQYNGPPTYNTICFHYTPFTTAASGGIIKVLELLDLSVHGLWKGAKWVILFSAARIWIKSVVAAVQAWNRIATAHVRGHKGRSSWVIFVKKKKMNCSIVTKNWKGVMNFSEVFYNKFNHEFIQIKVVYHLWMVIRKLLHWVFPIWHLT